MTDITIEKKLNKNQSLISEFIKTNGMATMIMIEAATGIKYQTVYKIIYWLIDNEIIEEHPDDTRVFVFSRKTRRSSKRK